MKRVLVLGATGLAGRGIVQALQEDEAIELCFPSRRHNLLELEDTLALYEALAPQCVVMAAGRVGGIAANLAEPGRFCYENLLMASTTLEGARRTGVAQYLYLGSACIYPPITHRAIRESDWLSAPFEQSNAPYAMAKSAAITLAQSYACQYGIDTRILMPSNLYGPYDQFDAFKGHAIGALIARMTEAKGQNLNHVEVWGDGTARREWLHSFDLGRAVALILKLTKEEYARALPEAGHLNVGSGFEMTTGGLAEAVAEAVGYKGALQYNSEKPVGAQRRLLDSAALKALGWQPQISFASGLKEAVRCHWRTRHARGGEEAPSLIKKETVPK